MGRFDDARFALEAATGGKNTLLLDDIGMPSVMVRIPAFRWSEVIDGGEDKLCSAFIVGGEEKEYIYISKYMNLIEYDRAYSLPARTPANFLTIDEAREACARKGKGWHLMTNAEWMAIAHWSRKNGTMPTGNNNFGKDIDNRHVHGVPAHGAYKVEQDKTEITLTGTGPDTWSHDGTSSGITDLHGNMWDHLAGLRLKDGEIQVIPDNDSALNVDESPDSPLWRAIDTGGNYVEPGSPGTYKYDGNRPGNDEETITTIPGGVRISTEIKSPQYTGKDPDPHFAYVSMFFQEIGLEEGVSAHMRLKEIGVYPVSPSLYGEFFFMRNYGERYLARGGSWYDIFSAGMWDTYLRDKRAYCYPDLGFRASYVE
jgi:hypothetical protein